MNKFVAIAALTLSANFAISANTITVYGYGADREKAKLDAFKTAIENVCGSNVLSSREHFNGNTVHNKVLAYSSCRVRNYSILEESEGKLLVQVSVEGLDISKRLSSPGNNRYVFDNTQIRANLESYKDEKTSGDELIDEVFRDYPYHAYELKTTKQPYIFADATRNFYLVVPYDLRWNKNYVNAVRETMTLLQSDHGTGTVKIMANNPKTFLGYKTYHNLNDIQRINQIKDRMSGSNELRLNIVARDNVGRHVIDICYSPDYKAGGIFYSIGIPNNISIFGDDKNRGEVKIRMAFPVDVIYDIYVDVVAERDCKL
jgi:hypothetical protein